MKHLKYLAAVLLAGIFLSSPARADQASTNADVVCSRSAEIAIVRFGMSWNDDPPQYAKLPASIDGGLSAAKPSKSARCRLPSRRQVKVRMWDAEAQSRGFGGGDPESFFDIWVGSRKVLSKQQWKPRAFDADPWTSAVVVRGRQLILCTRPSEDAVTTCGKPKSQ